ncbi:helix-turn-helix domain-containing protein [Paraburkholderia sp. RL18-103-BIB-C]|uniref:helix-turn-helix domain-containing protein n=1 Tax=Paraburkholderia sp. RL18-103-BIB-C TaxID=3031637 RepID=UPI0038BCB8D0
MIDRERLNRLVHDCERYVRFAILFEGTPPIRRQTHLQNAAKTSLMFLTATPTTVRNPMKTPEHRAPEVPALTDLVVGVKKAASKKAELTRGPQHERVIPKKESDAAVRGFFEMSQPRGPPEVEPGAMTIAEFCARYHINRVTLYKMRRDGIGPEVLLIGRKVLITYRAALEWQQRMIERSRATAEAI